MPLTPRCHAMSKRDSCESVRVHSMGCGGDRSAFWGIAGGGRRTACTVCTKELTLTLTFVSVALVFAQLLVATATTERSNPTGEMPPTK